MFWTVIYGQEGIIELNSYAFSFAQDSYQDDSSFNKDLEHDSYCKLFGEVETELEDEDENEGPCSALESVLDASIPLVLDQISAVSIAPDTLSVKLFILFHSWRSFLLA